MQICACQKCYTIESFAVFDHDAAAITSDGKHQNSMQEANPGIVDRADPGNTLPLARLRFDNDIPEKWLQTVLDNTPSLLPVSLIDERVQGTLTSLGREVATAAGPIDNLFLSSDGYIVLVETKLWRNPDARRSVIAQILDYAAQIRQWNYGKIEALWKARHGGGSIWAGISPEEPEQDWVDRVSRNLTDGRMTLVVVGDGIRSQSRELLAVVGHHPNFPFRLALVEMRMYALDDQRLLLVPDILLRTEEIERAVVRITYTGPTRPIVDVDVPTPTSTTDAHVRGSLSAEAFLRDLTAKGTEGMIAAETVETLLSLIEDTGLQLDWGEGGFTLRATNPAQPGTLLSLAAATRNGMSIYGYHPWLRKQVERSATAETAERAVAAQKELFRQFGGQPTSSGQQINVSLRDLRQREREFVLGLVALRDEVNRLIIESQTGEEPDTRSS